MTEVKDKLAEIKKLNLDIKSLKNLMSSRDESNITKELETEQTRWNNALFRVEEFSCETESPTNTRK